MIETMVAWLLKDDANVQVLVIAHRMETVMMADRIVLLDSGKLQDVTHSFHSEGHRESVLSSGLIIWTFKTQEDGNLTLRIEVTHVKIIYKLTLFSTCYYFYKLNMNLFFVAIFPMQSWEKFKFLVWWNILESSLLRMWLWVWN